MAQPKTNKIALAQSVFWVIFWVWALYGFVSDELIEALKVNRPLAMLGLDAAMVALAVWVVRDRVQWLVVALFAVVSWGITCVVNHEATTFWVNGLREFIGLLMVYPLTQAFVADDRDRRRLLEAFDRHGLYFLLVQAVCIVIQMLKYGAGDMVGGSFGYYYSGQVSVSIYLVSFALLRRRIDNVRFLSSLNENKIYVLLLFPTFLNETKVSFVMLALYFLLLLPIDRRLLIRLLCIIPAVALVAWVGVSMYAYTTEGNKSGNRFYSVDDLVTYFVFNDDLENVRGDALWNIENNGTTDVPRVTKLLYLALLDQQEPGHIATGFGIGQFKGGSVIAYSQFQREYDWLLMGTSPYLFHLYIQMGIVGVLLFQCYVLFVAIRRPASGVRRDVNLQLMLLAVLLLTYLYNDMLRNLAFCMIYFTLFALSWTEDERPGASAESQT